MTDDATPATDDAEISDEIIVQLSDYLDNTLPPEVRADVAKKIADDPTWKRAHAEMVEARDAVSGPLSSLQRARVHVQPTFDQDVTDLIHKRSAGGFFARRTFGDRVPFGALLVVALIALAAIGYVLWSSSTGSLKSDPAPPPATPGKSIAPKL